ncbi:MAG: TIM barrel protein [bacterium]|nr:TIM barrel protein [Candidatus Sumerlaeota bacterium]
MNVKLGFDLNCFSNRLMEPESWTDFVASCGVKTVQYNFDLLDHLLPRGIWERIARRTLDCCAEKGIRIKCAFGGHNHHQNYLGHPDDEVARAYEDSYCRMADVTAALGGEGFGTCFAITSTAVHNNPTRRAEVLNRAIDSYRRIAEYSRRQGVKYLLFETTSVPRETCATFAETDWVLEQLGDAAIPMKVCLDVGHRNQENSTAPEADYRQWILRYGRVSPLIHIQQCNAATSAHWPFLDEFNGKGDVLPAEVLRTVADSGTEDEVLLALEVRHRAYFPDEYDWEKNLRQSVDYWRRWITLEDESRS